MTERTIPEHAGANAAVPREKRTENRKSYNERNAPVIRAFLETLTNHEADTLRVGIAIAVGKTTLSTMSADDRLAVNRYLNNGTDNKQLTADNVQEHRMERAFLVLDRIADFCDKRQIVAVNKVLLSIATDPSDIGKTVASLDKRHAVSQQAMPNSNAKS